VASWVEERRPDLLVLRRHPVSVLHPGVSDPRFGVNLVIKLFYLVTDAQRQEPQHSKVKQQRARTLLSPSELTPQILPQSRVQDTRCVFQAPTQEVQKPHTSL